MRGVVGYRSSSKTWHGKGVAQGSDQLPNRVEEGGDVWTLWTWRCKSVATKTMKSTTRLKPSHLPEYVTHFHFLHHHLNLSMHLLNSSSQIIAYSFLRCFSSASQQSMYSKLLHGSSP